MKKIVPILTLLLLTGCASTSDIENVQHQVSDLYFKTFILGSAASEANRVAMQSEAQARMAKTAADKAEVSMKEANEKVNKFLETL